MLAQILLQIIFFYKKYISPFLGRNCRFYPSCSSYAHQAIERYGPFKGAYLIFRRLLRCHPYGGGSGFDPLP